MRDGQRGQVYDAERRLCWIYDNISASGNPVVQLGGIPLTLPPEARFGSVDSIQAYVNRVTEMPAVVAAFGYHGRVTVRQRKGHRCAHYEPEAVTIAVPDGWAMRELVILHELAHHYSGGQGAHHGGEFVATLAELAGTVMGPEVGLALRILLRSER